MENSSRAMATGGAGAVIGGIAGLAAGLGAMIIPGVGSAIAAGPLAVALGSVGIGAAAGGLIGALSAANIPAPEDRHQERDEELAPAANTVTPTPPSASRVYLDGLEMDPRPSRFEDFESDYRADFRSRNLSGFTYEQFSTAYRFGYDGAGDPRFSGDDWPTVEEYLRQEWESRNPGTWTEVRDAVRYAWQSHRLAG